MRIALCDDDIEMLSLIASDIKACDIDREIYREMTLETFQSGLDLVNTVKQNERFDIILLDILMPNMNGIETAREIRFIDKTVKIIFLTSSPQFALDSYDVKAYFYLLKNYSREKLKAVLQEAITEIADTADNFTMLKTRTGFVKLYFHSLIYLEIIGRTITFYLNNDQHYEVYGTLHEIEEIFLKRDNFIKPHRSYIVNMDCIRKLGRSEITMMNNHKIPVSKYLNPIVMKDYMDYSFQRGGQND